MTSKPSPSSCFVYVTPPGQTEPVTAARFELTTSRQGEPLGRLVYGKSYLARPDAVPLEPLELPLLEQTFETTQLRGVFGALRDASPDFWGRRVIERHAGKPMLTELDSLLLSPDDRAGALAFGLSATPPPPLRKFNQTLELEHLQSLADTVLAERSEEGPGAEPVEELLLVSQAPSFLLTTEQAEAIVSDVEARVRDGWYRTARRVGVTERDCEAISGAFCYPGFRILGE